MAEKSILTDELLRELISVGEVDVLVGVSTYNNAKTVGHVIRAIQISLLKYFPRDRAVVINADGGSGDATTEIVRAASINDLQRVTDLYALRTLHCISTVYSGSPSPGLALHTILAAAELLRAKACVIISPNALNIEPEWLERLHHWQTFCRVRRREGQGLKVSADSEQYSNISSHFREERGLDPGMELCFAAAPVQTLELVNEYSAFHSTNRRG